MTLSTPLQPADREVLSRLVAEAARLGRRVQVTSAPADDARTGNSDADHVARTRALRIDIAQLDRVLDHAAENLVAEVECGLGWQRFQARLAERGQRVPLDPPCPPTATIGAVLAADAFGPRRLRFGSARDWTLGSAIIRADGALVRAGGRVVKNVSGYDLTKLYIGSRGALGIWVEAAFKLDPVPDAVAELRFTTRSALLAWNAVRRVRDAPVTLVAAVAERTAGAMAYALTLTVESRTELIDAQVEDVERLASAESGVVLETIDRPSDWLSTRRPVLDAPFVVRRDYAPAEWPSQVVADAHEITYVGCGVSWFGVATAAAAHKLRGPAIDPPALALMRRIKSELDPHDVFGPGPLPPEER